jgi:hypothetical protein
MSMRTGRVLVPLAICSSAKTDNPFQQYTCELGEDYRSMTACFPRQDKGG